MPLIRYIQKITRDPNFLVWRDTVYINADGRPQYLSLKLVNDIDALLQGKISEYIFQSEFKEVKLSCDEVKIIGRNLVAEYLFYEGSGTVLHDTSGNKNNGMFTGTPSWKQLINNKRYVEFDGTSIWADIPFSSTLNIQTLNHITVEVITRLKQVTANSNTYLTIFDNGRNGGVGYYLTLRFDNTLLWEKWENYKKIGDAYTYNFFESNKWTHIFVDDDGAKMCLYRNNILVYEGNSTLFTSLPSGYTNHIGGVWSSPYDIALVRVFSCKLSSNTRDSLFKLAQIAVPELSS